MLIGELARRAGLRASAIRYYEEIGLMQPPERASGQRRYGKDAFQRLSVIGAAQRVGLSLAEIRALLEADDRGAGSGRLQDLARRKLPEVDALIEHARLVRGWLEAAADCECPSLEDCPLFVS